MKNTTDNTELHNRVTDAINENTKRVYDMPDIDFSGTEEAEPSHFEKLSAINLNHKREAVGHLDYISWPHAWEAVAKIYPLTQTTVYENADGWNYHHDGKTAWVKVGMRLEPTGIEHVEYLPVYASGFTAMPLEKITSAGVLKAIQRATVKLAARFGCCLYVYAGEDLPNSEVEQAERLAELQEQELMEDTANYLQIVRENIDNDDQEEVQKTLDELGKDKPLKKAVWVSLEPEYQEYIKQIEGISKAEKQAKKQEAIDKAIAKMKVGTEVTVEAA